MSGDAFEILPAMTPEVGRHCQKMALVPCITGSMACLEPNFIDVISMSIDVISMSIDVLAMTIDVTSMSDDVLAMTIDVLSMSHRCQSMIFGRNRRSRIAFGGKPSF